MTDYIAHINTSDKNSNILISPFYNKSGTLGPVHKLKLEERTRLLKYKSCNQVISVW